MAKEQGHEDRAVSSVVLVIPLFNEESVLPLLIEEIEAFRSHRKENISVLFVDDGSTDASNALVRTMTAELPGYGIMRFSRNFGHQLAVTAGLQQVDREADAAIIMDADLQDPLDIAGLMIDEWKKGYDVVYGVRTRRAGTSILARVLYRAYYRFFSRFTDLDAPLDAGDFRLLSRRVIRAYQEFGEQQPYVRGLVAWLGFRQTGIEYSRPARAAGKSKYSWRNLFRLGFDGIASFSGKPLRYAVKFGLLLSVLSVFGLIWAVVEKLVLNTDVPGWASLVFIGFFFGGLQLFFLGVLGSYVARVYDEVKSRPRFIVQDEWISCGSARGDGRIRDHESHSGREQSPPTGVRAVEPEHQEYPEHETE